jgi:predicted DCC family thiol-disulfide oxidoreductase YuxK
VNANQTTTTPRGEVFYDAGCGMCSRGATRWGGVFARRGFHWLPLQTPGTPERTGASEVELRGEMKLRFADGRVVGGATAWAVLFRAVWWLWPLGVLMGLPGLNTLSAAAYRWIARNRYGISGACGLRRHSLDYHRHGAFLELP